MCATACFDTAQKITANLVARSRQQSFATSANTAVRQMKSQRFPVFLTPNVQPGKNGLVSLMHNFGPFLWPALRPGTRYQTTCEIRYVPLTVFAGT